MTQKRESEARYCSEFHLADYFFKRLFLSPEAQPLILDFHLLKGIVIPILRETREARPGFDALIQKPALTRIMH